jgi:hypothetical protein
VNRADLVMIGYSKGYWRAMNETAPRQPEVVRLIERPERAVFAGPRVVRLRETTGRVIGPRRPRHPDKATEEAFQLFEEELFPRYCPGESLVLCWQEGFENVQAKTRWRPDLSAYETVISPTGSIAYDLHCLLHKAAHIHLGHLPKHNKVPTTSYADKAADRAPAFTPPAPAPPSSRAPTWAPRTPTRSRPSAPPSRPGPGAAASTTSTSARCN